MIDFLIKKPVSVLMTFLALVLLGIFVSRTIPVTPLPDIAIPEITVHVTKDNTSAMELERAVVQALRLQLMQIEGVEDVHSETRNGYSRILLRFKYGVDTDLAFLEANEKIDVAMNRLPKDMERPRVVKANTTDIPVFYLNISLKNDSLKSAGAERYYQLSEFAESVIKRRFEQLSEVAMADMTGMAYPEIYIRPYYASLNQLGITTQMLQSVIENNNLLFGNIVVRDGILEYDVHFATSRLTTLNDVRAISFRINDRVINLTDVAEIGQRPEKQNGMFMANEKPAINLAIIKQPGSRMEELRKSCNDLIKWFERKYPDIAFVQTQDQTALLDYSISNLKQDLLFGSLMAFAILFLFLRDVRSALLIIITVPVALVISMLIFHLVGLSINIISLAGLVLGVGLMIDNSIIVIDNITQKRSLMMPLDKSCVVGAGEVFRPLLSSVLTTCSVFIPLIFISGIGGALFYDQAIAVTIGICVSLLVAITLLPTMYYAIYRRKGIDVCTKPQQEGKMTLWLIKVYEKGINWVFRYKVISLGIVCLLIAAGYLLFMILPKEQLPAFQETELTVQVDWNEDIHVSENRQRVISLLESLNSKIIQSNAEVGQQQYLLSNHKEMSASESRIYLQTTSEEELAKLEKEIMQYFASKYPEAIIVLEPPKNLFERVFGEQEKDLVAKVYDPEQNSLPSYDAVKSITGRIRRLEKKEPVYTTPRTTIVTVNLDMEKMKLYDLDPNAIFKVLNQSFNTEEIGSMGIGARATPIVTSGNDQSVEKVIFNTMVKTNKGVEMPLSSFVKLSQEATYKMVEGDWKGAYVPIALNTGNPVKVMNNIKAYTAKTYPKLECGFSGSHFSNKALVKNMAIVLLVAVLLLYFILAAQFESLVQPLIVLLELPISICGAFIMLYIFKSSINLMSLIGIIAMSGIIINDSILKIDTINQYVKMGNMSLMEAIHKGGVTRLKSIIMTALTTVLSITPFLFGSDMGSVMQKPLSLTIIGGMIIGTFVSLFFIPLVYWWWMKKGEKR